MSFKIGERVTNGNGLTGRVITLPVGSKSDTYIVRRADGRAFMVAGEDLTYQRDRGANLQGSSLSHSQ
jgi:hypothetical protein